MKTFTHELANDVDDVFTIFDKRISNVNDFILQLNKRFPSRNSTFEQKIKEALPVLYKFSYYNCQYFRTSIYFQYQMTNLNCLVTTFPTYSTEK